VIKIKSYGGKNKVVKPQWSIRYLTLKEIRVLVKFVFNLEKNRRKTEFVFFKGISLISFVFDKLHIQHPLVQEKLEFLKKLLEG
jgi:hypothetical protein